MGAHFGLQLNESMDVAAILKLNTPVLLTDVHQGTYLHELMADKKLPWPCIWVFGHEGQGVSLNWPDDQVQRVRIAQPGGQESLNVAAAAAICLHASACQRV
jgi:TrmH family RNA methyltransferase